MNVISLFAGAGGLDLGFSQAGFNVRWACEYDKTIWKTYMKNHPNTYLETKSITEVEIDRIIRYFDGEEIDGIIGGPPCQSWSVAGARRGIEDARGQLFNDYLRILRGIQPRFFMVENVPGMLSNSNINTFNRFIEDFRECGYRVSFQTLNAKKFGVPQERKRVIIVGYRNDLNLEFNFNELIEQEEITLEDAIRQLPEPLPAQAKNYTNGQTGQILNNEYYVGSFSSMYMSRNRKKNWDQQSFTIQASGRQAPLHPSSSEMIFVEKDKRVFEDENNVRRLSVRECAIIQGFPMEFEFIYDKIDNGYKMIGNAVPVTLANTIANKIMEDLESI